MTTIFSHSLDDPGKDYIPFNTDASPPAVIRMQVNSNGNFVLVANRAGYLHLARVFAELGLRELSNGHHFHKDAAFHLHTASAEFTFALDDDL